MKTTDAGRCQISSEILNARQLEKVFNMPRPGKKPAPGCPNACPACPQAPNK